MPVSVLFVCMGNICRSPTAEAIFKKIVAESGKGEHFSIESAGTHAYHIGHGADPRSTAAAKNRGYDLSSHRARRVDGADFSRFHHIVAMDDENMTALSRACPTAHRDKLSLFLEHAPDLRVREVPDPYYGGDEGFERVIDLCEAAAQALFDKLTGELR